MYVAINSKLCELFTDNVPLIVCTALCAFLVPFNIALQMYSFIFRSVQG